MACKPKECVRGINGELFLGVGEQVEISRMLCEEKVTWAVSKNPGKEEVRAGEPVVCVLQLTCRALSVSTGTQSSKHHPSTHHQIMGCQMQTFTLCNKPVSMEGLLFVFFL